jgi:hypothetical protein
MSTSEVAVTADVGRLYETALVSQGGSREVDVIAVPVWPGALDDPSFPDVRNLFGDEFEGGRHLPPSEDLERVGPGLVMALFAASLQEAEELMYLSSDELRARGVDEAAVAFAEHVAYVAPIAVERSPLSGETLVSILTGAAGFGGIMIVAGNPILAVPVAGGLIVARALWKGAEPEVARFGEDVAKSVFDKLRKRLGLDRSKK